VTSATATAGSGSGLLAIAFTYEILYLSSFRMAEFDNWGTSCTHRAGPLRIPIEGLPPGLVRASRYKDATEYSEFAKPPGLILPARLDAAATTSERRGLRAYVRTCARMPPCVKWLMK